MLVYAKGWAQLAGGNGIWPENVEQNGINIPVVKRNKVPSIYLLPGEYLVKGSFEWSKIPELIKIPSGVGLVRLFINGSEIHSPVIDKRGRLWIENQGKTSKEKDTFSVSIFRLIDDLIPQRVTSQVQIDISGTAREIKLNEILLEHSVPMSIQSPLPARIGPKGELNIQARPGRWKIKIISRYKGHVEEIGPVKCKYGNEIWSFKPENNIRMAKISGVLSVEPDRAGVPFEWKRFPAFMVKPDSTVIFTEIRRGDPDPAPDRLNLYRTWWLDFDGNGFTIQDKITGTMSRQWYLAMNPPGILGRVSVDGRDQLITIHGENKKNGVELRRGKLDLVADSRLRVSTGFLPAVGWDHNFQSVSGVFNILMLFSASIFPESSKGDSGTYCWTL